MAADHIIKELTGILAVFAKKQNGKIARGGSEIRYLQMRQQIVKTDARGTIFGRSIENIGRHDLPDQILRTFPIILSLHWAAGEFKIFQFDEHFPSAAQLNILMCARNFQSTNACIKNKVKKFYFLIFAQKFFCKGENSYW